MISLICVYSDKNQYEKQLLHSLENQDTEYELIAIDNTNGQFSCASKALNEGVRQSKGDVLIFSHQDIYLKSLSELSKFAKAVTDAGEGTVVGTQGVIDNSKVYYSNITAGDEFIPDIIHDYEYRLYKVSTVDEGFFGMLRTTWEKHPFDEVLCDNWHLYCVESCLYNRANGGNVYVYPIQLHHFSMGKISIGYMSNLKRLCKVYRNSFRYIWTTCYKVYTNPIYINTLIWIWIFNRKLRGKKL